MREAATVQRPAEEQIPEDLRGQLADIGFTAQRTADGIPTLWIEREDLPRVLRPTEDRNPPVRTPCCMT